MTHQHYKRFTIKQLKKVTEDFESLSFNTAISQLMVFINECYKADNISKAYAEGFVKMLAPIAPHVGENYGLF